MQDIIQDNDPNMKHKSVGPKPTMLYRFPDEDEYEYISRVAFHQRHNSKQKVMDDVIYKSGWKRHLEELRDYQRKHGLSDSRFLSPYQKKKKGLVVRTGRKKKSDMPISKAA